MSAAAVVHDEVVPARAPWSGVVAAGHTLRIIDLGGNQAADCILYNANEPDERYSASDTIAEQGNIFLTTGSLLRSNEGNFLMAHAPRGMGKRDMVSNINWFMNVPVEADGTLGIVDGISAPGLYVDLLAHMDTLVVISNCPQINNPCNGFDPTPIRLVVTGPVAG